MKILIATLNKTKFALIQDILKDVPVTLVPQYECPEIPALTNPGLSFIEKALIKARHAAKYSGLPSIADDSGVAVDALGGAPGIHSSHFADYGATEAENLDKLLKSMQNVEQADRTAHMHSAIAFVLHANDPTPIICQAEWEGLILQAPSSGEGGYGYDNIFYLPEHNCSVADLSLEAYNKYSPRARAFRKLATHLPSVGNTEDE